MGQKPRQPYLGPRRGLWHAKSREQGAQSQMLYRKQEMLKHGARLQQQRKDHKRGSSPSNLQRDCSHRNEQYFRPLDDTAVVAHPIRNARLLMNREGD